MVTASNPQLSDYMQSVRVEVESELAEITRFHSDCPNILEQAIRYTLLAPGKRLRPILVFMASEACGQRTSATLDCACAVEMIHTYSLIHDDLPAMDDDAMRRGQPACHIQFGEANAILAGDALLAYAFQVVSGSDSSSEVCAACCRELATAAGPCHLVGGQVDDLAAEHQDGDLSQLQHIHQRKTGSLFRVSLKLGGLAAGADSEQIDHLDTYGKYLGLAFQIVDDLLDCSGDQQWLGKQIGKDTEHGKLTYPRLRGMEASRNDAQELIHQAIEELNSFGGAAESLRQLASYVLERNN